MKNPEQVMAGRIVAAVDADEKSEGCDLSAGMFGLEMSNFIREMVAMEERLAKAEALLTECQRLTRRSGSSLWEVVHEFLGSPEGDAYRPPEPGTLPHPDRGHMWQFIDNALQGTVEASLRGDICNKLAPLLVCDLAMVPCSERMPNEGQEVLVRYAKPWPYDKDFKITGATLYQAFDDDPQLWWFNGRGEVMSGKVTHWMKAPVVSDQGVVVPS